MGYRLAIRFDWTVWAYDSAVISAAELGMDFALFAWQNSREERLWRIA